MRNLKSKNNFIKKYKPVINSLRSRIILRYPKKLLRIKNLSYSIKNHAGRNNTGTITCRHRGSRSHKRFYRDLDFQRNIAPFSLASFLNTEVDPNRSANIARYYTKVFQYFYSLAPHKIERKIQGTRYP